MGIADVVAQVQQAQAWQRMGTPMAGVSPAQVGAAVQGAGAQTGKIGVQQLIAQQIAQRAAADANWAKLSQTPWNQMGVSRPFTGPQQAAVNRLLSSGGNSALPTLESIGAQAAKLPMSGVGPSSPLTAAAMPAAGPAASAPSVGQALVRATPPPYTGALPGAVTAGVEAAPVRAGLIAAVRNQLGTAGRGIAANGWKGGLLPAAIATAGSMAGSSLDESQLLGGDESKLNDTASKALKWGGAGAGAGMLVGGPVGALIGGAAGGVVGVMHEGAERQGWLGTPTKQEQIDTLIHDSEKAAARIGLPAEVTNLLKQQYIAGKEFAKSKDEKLALAQTFADNMEAQAMNYIADPSQYQTAEQSEADLMIQRSMMMNIVKPYADNFLARSSAEADTYANMAQGAGNMAPMYEQMAAQTRASGARHAMGVIQETQMTPYTQALQAQAGYLSQISQQTMQQAIGSVMQPQQAQAGSTDLTAIIDQYANAAQPQ